MRVFSKIVEADELICDIVVPDAYAKDAVVVEHFRNFSDEKSVSFDVNIIHSAGLYIQDTHIEAHQQVSDNFFTHGQHVRFFFYLKGHSNVKQGAGNQDYEHAAGMLQRNYLDIEGGGGLVRIQRGDEVDHAIIKMSREFYIHLLKDEPWIDDDPFHQYILSGAPENRANETSYMNMKILGILQEILNSSHIQHHRYHYLRLKLKELLFAIYQHTRVRPARLIHQITSDMDVLEKIRAHLILHLDNPPNISELSKMFLFNEKKLKQDFKTVYGCTVYAFVIQERMKKAKKLLFENHNVNELAMLLGYQSVSHFIKIFKAYHGCTPKEALVRFKTLTSHAPTQPQQNRY